MVTTSVMSSDAGVPIDSKSVVSKLKACPTLPVTKVTLPLGVPSFADCVSVASPSPRHQLTRPAGMAAHGGAPGPEKVTVIVWLAAPQVGPLIPPQLELE